MKTGPLQQCDNTPLTQLWNRSACHDQLSVDQLHAKVWGDSDYCEKLGLTLLRDEKPIALAMGVVRQVDGRSIGYVKLMAVAPEFQGQGLGRRLVRELEDRLSRESVVAIRPGESAPDYIFPGIDVRYTRAMLLFEALGYQRIGETYNLVAELTGHDFSSQQEESKLAQQGIEVRRASVRDNVEIERLLLENWPSWRSEVFVALAHDPPTLHLAIADGKVVGFSAFDSNQLGTSWFGPMGTCPTFHKQGIGQLLLKRCLADMQSQGCARATIPWVGPVRFYAKHVGAQIERVFYRYEKKMTELTA
jgi:ribosomal protein S18 acetylase RimI-like enzyme